MNPVTDLETPLSPSTSTSWRTTSAGCRRILPSTASPIVPTSRRTRSRRSASCRCRRAPWASRARSWAKSRYSPTRVWRTMCS